MPDTDEEIDEYIVDGVNDGELILFIHRKARVDCSVEIPRPDKHEKQEDFTHFCDVLSRLYDASAKPQKLNKKLSETLQELED